MYATDITPYKGNPQLKLGPPVNVFDLYRDIHQKKMKRLSGYDAILQKCYSKIKGATAVEQMRVLYEVPEFVVGVPIYDIQHCMAYMIHQLRTHGFIVNYFFPRILHISWDPKDLPAAQQSKARHILAPSYEAPTAAVDIPDIILPNSPPGLGNAKGTTGTRTREPRMKTAPTKPRTSLPEYMTSFKPSGKYILNLT